MRRREFIGLLGGTAVWPLAASAQQPAMPVIGFLSGLSQATAPHMTAAWQRGLRESGFIETRNVAIEYRFADGQYGRLRALAAELVRRPVDLILAQGPPAALAAKAVTTTIPIVFVVGVDPVAAGLVGSFSRPGGNATGMTLITGPLGQKRLEIVRLAFLCSGAYRLAIGSLVAQQMARLAPSRVGRLVMAASYMQADQQASWRRR